MPGFQEIVIGDFPLTPPIGTQKSLFDEKTFRFLESSLFSIFSHHLRSLSLVKNTHSSLGPVTSVTQTKDLGCAVLKEVVIGFYPHTLLVARKNQFLAKKLFGYLQVLCF